MGENDLDYTFPNGDYYEGEWKNGKPHGQGTFIYNTKYNNQNKYVGGFKDGKHHGHGSYTYSYGIKYVGEFNDGKWHGHGSYNYANGNTYEGLFKKGETKEVCYTMPLNLGVNSYSLTVALHTDATHIAESFDWVNSILVFNVIPSSQHFFSGYCRMEPYFSVKSLSENNLLQDNKQSVMQ